MELSRRDALRAGLVGTLVGGAVGAGSAGTARADSVVGQAGEGWVSVLDHGAVGDGTTDDTAAIQAALNAAKATNPHRGVLFPAGRTYRVSDQLVASGLTDTVISGHGATVVLAGAAPADPGGKSVLRLTGCRRVKLLGLGIRDADRTEQYNGIAIASSSAVVVDGVLVRDVRWTGIGVFDSTPGSSDDVVVTNCTVEGTRFGIVSNGKDVRITDNHVAMDWPSTAEAQAKGGVWSTPSDYYDGIMVLHGADRTVVSGNTVTECGQGGIYTQACTNLVVADNTVTGCQLRGIEIDGDTGTAVGVSITGNVVTDCFGQINVVKARDVTIVGNRAENPDPLLRSSCIAVNIGTNRAVVVGNHLRQANPSWPAIFVDSAATDVTLAWNAVNAQVPVQAPADTVVMQRSGPGQIRTEGKLIAVGGIGVGNSAPASTPGKVVRKIEIFSSTGASLGWIPVYQSIA